MARRSIGRALLLGFNLLAAATLARLDAQETLVVRIVLNQQDKGEFFVAMTAERDFLVRVQDLKAMGLREPKGAATEIAGEPFLSLRSIERLHFVFDEKTLTLMISAAPSLLSRTVIDFLPARQANVEYPRNNSVFFNYRAGYLAGNSFSFKEFSVRDEIGIRFGEVLLFSDSDYTKTPDEQRLVRMTTNATYDKRETLQRWVLGDFVASSGNLGSAARLGGLSFSKVYRINPYLITRPLVDFRGAVGTPSQIEVYLDGVRIRTERLAPGEFDLNNIVGFVGARELEVVWRDAFGREQRIRQSVYFSDLLLRKGFSEYSYSVGLARRKFGVESNSYHGLAFLGYHRYGATDFLTVGLAAEGKQGLAGLGSELSVLLGQAGVATLSASGSAGQDGKRGLAGSFVYLYQGQRIGARLLLRGFSKEFQTIGTESQLEKTRYEVNAGVNYATRSFGSLSLDFTRLDRFEGQSARALTATYSKGLSGRITLLGSIKRVSAPKGRTEFFAGISVYPWKDTTLSTRYQRDETKNSVVLQAQKNPPLGEGFGYRVALLREGSGDERATDVNPSFQWNGKYGIYTAEYAGRYGSGRRKDETYLFSAAGGVGWVGGTLGFSRPIIDSFGLVEVAELRGVRVYQNNQEIGKTNAAGSLFLPNLASYDDNLLSIDDKDIPIDYSLATVKKYVSPPLRSGSVIRFPATRIQSVTGMLKFKRDGEVQAVEFEEVTLDVGGKKVAFPTGKGGEFYLENLGPGTYQASFQVGERTCRFSLTIPRTNDFLIDLGEIICADQH